MTIAPGPGLGGAFITDFFAVDFELLISPRVALLIMLLLSNGLFAAAGGLAAPPVIPNESIDPIRF